MDIYLGIDTSTTSTKTIAIDQNGKILAVSSSGYSFETPFPLWSEQDPHLWWQATKVSMCECVMKAGIEPSQVKGIGLTGQMHGLVILDEKGEILRPSILWNDQRTQKQCDEIRELIGRKEFIRITGNDALTGFTAPKILWVKEEEPAIFKKIKHILLPKDYIRLKLTGEYAIDRAGGSGTVLFNLADRDWSSNLIKTLGLNAEWFPPTFEGTHITGTLTKQAAEEVGLIEGIPVFGGGGDQAASAVGTGAVKEGIVSLSLGTSGVIFASVDSPFIEPEGRLHAFCHAVPAKWHLMGVMLSAAGSLRWYKDTFRDQSNFDDLLTGTKGIMPGSDGLIFLPYLTGERTPYPDPLARGGFIGITVRHTIQHFTRAVLEGVAFGLRDSYELMKEAGLKNMEQIRITGGGAKSLIWRQIIADIFNTEIVSINSEEGAAFGAALLAATGAGSFASVEQACSSTISITDRVIPGQDVERYNKIYAEYRLLYPALKDTFHRMPDIIS
ncbi:MAG: xylulokinase [Chloroflexi bacterium]|nr:xylulokinase [Chloroflexota bacterium]